MISQKSITIISVSVAVFCIAVVVLIWRFPIPTPVPYVTPPNYEVPTVLPIPSSPSSAPIPTGDNQVRTPVSFQAKSLPSPTAVAIIQDPGVVWLSRPIKIPIDRSILAESYKTYGDDNLEFYKIGTEKGQDLIYVLIHEMGTGSYLLRKEGSRYALIANGRDAYLELFNKNSVYVDHVTRLKSIDWPQQLVMHGIKFRSGGYGFGGPYFFDDDKEFAWTLFDNTPYGPVYYGNKKQVLNSDIGPVNVYRFSLRAVNGVQVEYSVGYDFKTDDGVALFRWNDGSLNKALYSDGISTGCGVATSRIVPLSQVNGQVFQSGTTTAGEPIYEFTNMNHPIVQEGYKNTNGHYYIYSQENGGTEYSLSLEQYYYNHGVVIYRDQLGRFIAFFNGTFAPQAECGKPVIYLYPEKPTQVTVKVGADIRISEPEYYGPARPGDTGRSGGWKVLAEPTGKQTLFWEGLGYGPYPEVTEGFIVKRENLEATLRQHLTKLGANARESQDFLDFWLAKMPNTPYTRLTWFNTKEMDALAPLYVNPKPDTVIRIFLDFEGLEKPIDLPKQELSSIPRKGFDLFEWGGLLRNGHHTNP